MNHIKANADCESLTLRSDLSEIARLPPWIQKLASLYSLPERTQFAMDLCLEEAVSNVIRHGYAGESHHTLTVRSEMRPERLLTLIVEDDAPPFNPLLLPEPVLPNSIGEIEPGGQGVLLLKKFADAVEYHRTASGNRLSMGFRCPEPSRAVTPEPAA
jgi:serine/threonine-protein kinase RsbW